MASVTTILSVDQSNIAYRIWDKQISKIKPGLKETQYWEKVEKITLGLLQSDDVVFLKNLKVCKPVYFERLKEALCARAIDLEATVVLNFCIDQGVPIKGGLFHFGDFEEASWLGYAIEKDRVLSAQLLLAKGANPDETDCSGWGNLSAWEKAAYLGSLECLHLFVSNKGSLTKEMWPMLQVLNFPSYRPVSVFEKKILSLQYQKTLKVMLLLFSKGLFPDSGFDYLNLLKTAASQKEFKLIELLCDSGKKQLEERAYQSFISGPVLCEIYGWFKKFHPDDLFPVALLDHLQECGASIHKMNERGEVDYSLMVNAIEHVDRAILEYGLSKKIDLNFRLRESDATLWEYMFFQHHFRAVLLLTEFEMEKSISPRIWALFFEQFGIDFNPHSGVLSARQETWDCSNITGFRSEEPFELKVLSKSDEAFEGEKRKMTHLIAMNKDLGSTQTSLPVFEEKGKSTTRTATEESIDVVTVISPARGGAGDAIKPIKEEKELDSQERYFKAFCLQFKKVALLCGKKIFHADFREFIEQEVSEIESLCPELFSAGSIEGLKKVLDLPPSFPKFATIQLFFTHLIHILGEAME